MSDSKISRTAVLYSPGFGAGWTTWATSIPPAAQEMMLRHTGLIAALDAGEKLVPSHPAVVAFLEDMRELGGGDIYLGGLEDLRVYRTESRVRIDEYDGNESVTVEGGDTWM